MKVLSIRILLVYGLLLAHSTGMQNIVKGQSPTGNSQGYYRTRAANRYVLDFGGLPLFRGIPSYTSHNVRSELATIFMF